MKSFALWSAFALLLMGIASMLKYANDPQRWRYYFSLAGTCIFALIFLAGLWAAFRRPKNKS